MALGSNIEYKARALFQAALDEKSAKQVEDRFVKLSKEASEMSRKEFAAAFSSLGQEINNALAKLKLPQIDMEKLIQLPQVEAFSKLGTEFGTRFAEGFQGAVAGGGISTSIQKQITQLEAEKNRLLSLQKSLPQNLKRYEYLSGLGYAEKGDVHAFSLDDIKRMSKDGSADTLAQSFTDDYYGALDALDGLNVGTEKYHQTLLKVYEAASNVFRMQATIDKNPSLIKDKNVLMDYGYETLQETVQNELLARDEDFGNFIKQENNLLEQIPAKLTEIEQRLGAIRQNNPEIINKEEASAGIQTLNEIEAAYKRILNTHGKIGKQGSNIQNALNFDPSTSKQGIQTLYDAYTKMPEDSPWEVQYQALLKYVRLYESYLNSSNTTHRNKVTKPNNEFTKLYEQLKPMAANAENMLQNVLNMANKVPLVGIGETGAAKNAEATTQVAVEAQNQAEAGAKARAEAEAKAKADAESAAAAEKERLAQEAATKAAQQAAAAAEQEKAAKEGVVKASKEATSSYTTGGILDNPMFANMFKKTDDSAEKKHMANEGSAEAAERELNTTKQTTVELEKQQKLLLYRRVEGEADLSRVSGRSIDALYDKSNKPIIQGALEMGFGGFGDGLYTTTFDAAKDLLPGKGNFSFFEFDASSYNLFINKTVEQAQALQSFLLSLQKFVGAGTLLDTSELTHIADLSKDQLFEEAQRIFKNFSMTKQQFDAWIESARVESETIANLFANGQVPSNRHNFGTRFMQALGYEGVLNQTGNLDIDGNYQGSVIYDPKDDIKQSARVFNSTEEFAAYIKAQAQAHQENTSAINAEAQAQEKLNGAESQNPPAQDDSGVHNANADAVNNEAQSQEQLAEKIKKTQALIKNQQAWLKTLDPYLNDAEYKTSGKKEATERLKSATNRMVNYRRNPDEYMYESMAEEKRTVDWYKAYQEAQRQGVADSVLQRNNVGVGQFEYERALAALQKERDMRAQLLQEEQKELQVLQQQFDAQNKINAAKTQEPPPVDDTSKLQDENVKLDEQNGKLKENINLKTQANGQGVVPPTGIGGTGTTSPKVTPVQTVPDGATSAEAMELEAVRAKVLEVTNAINMKNKAFYNEGQIVGQVVGKENAALISLKGNIDAITSAVNTKTQAFVREEMAVRQAVGKENAALISLQSNVSNVASSLGGTLSNLQGVRMPNLGGVTSQTNITNEAQALANLRTIIDEVTAAVRTKTTSFVQEEMAVRQSVGNEITALIQLLQNVNNVNTAVSTLTQGLNNTLNNAGAFNGINLNVNATVDLTAIETTLANILTAIPNAGTNVQNNNAGGGQGGAGGQGGGRNPRAVAQHQIDKLESDLEKYRSGLDAIGNLTQSYNAELDRLLAQLGTLQTSGDVTRWRDEFSQFKNIVGMYDNDDKRAVNRMEQPTQADVLGNYKEIGKLLAQRETATSPEEINSINQRIKAWAALAQEKRRSVDIDKSLIRSAVAVARQEALTTNAVKTEEKAYKDNAKARQQAFKQEIKDAQREAGLSKSKSTEGRAIDTLVSARQIQGIGPEQIANLDAYEGKIEALRNTISNFPRDGVASEAQKNQLIAQRLEVDAYTKEIQELIANYERLSGENATILGTSTLGLGASADAYKQELTETIMAQTQGRAQIRAYDAETRTLTYTLKTGKGEFTQYAASVRQADGALVSVRGTTTRAMGVFESIGKKIREYSYYFTGSMMIMRVISQIKEGITIVKEIDSALTELKKVTDETEESYDKFLNTAAKTAEKVGSTIKDVVSSTADWARLGYSMQEAHTLATSTQILMNVSEFDDVSKATDTLISAVQAFKYSAEESMDVVDIMNTIGNNYAISTADLAQSLTKSSGSLVAANGTLEEAVALTATANTIIQDADVVGTALKTVAMRLRGTSTEEMESEGLETDGVIESKSKLQSKIKGLSGVDILTDSGAYKSTYQILSEIAEVWGDINDMDQAALLELLAGKRAGSVMSAILQNPETLKNAFESASDATGSAMTENEKYLDSIQGRLDLFTNSVQTMWSDTLDSGFMKFIINIGTGIIKMADGIDILGVKIGNMWTTVAFLIAAIIKFKNKMTWGEFFTSIGTSITGLNVKLEGLFTRLGILKTTSKATQSSMKGVTVEMFQQKLAATGVSAENQKLILSKMGLDAANKSQVISSKALTLSTLQEAVANKTLTASQAVSMAQKLGVIKVTKGLNVANASTIMRLMGVDRQQRINIISSLGLTMQTKKLTKEEIMNALAKQGIIDKAKQEAIANEMLKVSNGKLLFSIKSLGQGIKNFLAKNKLLVALAAFALAFQVVKQAVDALTTTTEELKEEYNELNSKLDKTKSKLNDITSQLSETNDKIAEIMSQGTLSFTDQEELEKLRAQTAELQRQKDVYEEMQKQQQIEMNGSATDMAENYMDIGLTTGKTTEENVGETAATTYGIAAGSTAVAATLTAIGGTNAWNPVGWVALIGAAIATLITGVSYAISESEEKVGDSLENMKTKYAELQKEYQEVQAEYLSGDADAEDLEEAEKEFSDYKATMSKHIAELDTYYSQIDWATATTKQREAMTEFYDTQDTWAIQSGSANAKTNAIARIFGTHATDDAKEIKEQIEAALEAGTEFDVSKVSEGFKDRLYGMGLTFAEIQRYFEDLKKEEEEAEEFTTYDAVESAAALTEGIEELKGAFEEFNKTGIVTAKTLVGLQEKFGHLGDKWTEFVKIMTSGTASTKEGKEAIEEMIDGLISEALSGEQIDDEQYIALWTALTSAGVENATEILNGIREYSNIGEEISNEVINNGKEIDTAIAEYEKKNGKLTEDQKKIVKSTYEAKSTRIKADNREGLKGQFDVAMADYETKRRSENEMFEETIRVRKEHGEDSEEAKTAAANEERTLDELEQSYLAVKEVLKSAYENDKNILSKEQIEAYFNDNPEKINSLFGDIDWDKFQTDSEYRDKIANRMIGSMDIPDVQQILNKYFEGNDLANEAAAAGQAALDGIEEELDLDVKLEIENPDKIIDDIQSVFDTLKDAVKEFNEEGYLSVDTVQTLLDPEVMDPKYLTLLEDENGQLKLNEQALYDIAVARLTDLGVKRQDELLTQAENDAKEGSIDKLRESTDVLYSEADALEAVNRKRIESIRKILEERQAKGELQDFDIDEYINSLYNQYDAIGNMINSAKNNIRNTMSSSGNTAKAEASDKFQKAMDYWENRIGAEQSRFEQVQNEVDLLEKQGKIAGKEYYQEQIASENRRLKLLQQQKAEAKKYLGQFKEGSDEWFRKKPVYWETNKCNPLNCWNSLRVLYTTTQG